ncbi:hypothetical protein J3E07_001362 [Methanococcus voltae]|uniref:Uncharacterized protein n=1 Tax=Methanococcus voltae TaxID=2188 RepID=A0A8J7RHG0_METVO|nr:hypothetical protein [Methanococcus voltae]MBP2201922.1 hypothetical protein [Methanococcus voltae]
MQKLFLPVLNITNIDGFEITEEWLSKNYETLRGKPVNIDHNYDKKSNYAVGHVSEIILSKTNELYAVVEVFEEIYGLKSNLKGCSIEYNENTSGEEGIIRALALCFETIPKVEFAKSTGNIDVAEILASLNDKNKKSGKNNNDNNDNKDNKDNEDKDENKSLEDFQDCSSKINSILSELEVLRDFCNKNNSLLKTIIKKSDEKTEIMASMYFDKFNNSGDDLNNYKIKSFKNKIKEDNLPNPNSKSLKSINMDF